MSGGVSVALVGIMTAASSLAPSNLQRNSIYERNDEIMFVTPKGLPRRVLKVSSALIILAPRICGLFSRSSWPDGGWGPGFLLHVAISSFTRYLVASHGAAHLC